MQALRAIQMLVHDKGMTLKGAEKLLSDQGIDSVLTGDVRIVAPVNPETGAEAAVPSPARDIQATVRRAFEIQDAPDVTGQELESILTGLTDLKARLDRARLKRAA